MGRIPRVVTAGQVIVGSQHVDVPAGQRAQVGRQSSRQRLALAGAHLGDLPEWRTAPPDQLDVVVAQPDPPGAPAPS